VCVCERETERGGEGRERDWHLEDRNWPHFMTPLWLWFFFQPYNLPCLSRTQHS
jgi:hypothetical protein